MYEEFKFACHGIAYGTYLLKGEFPLKNQSGESQAFQKYSLLRSPYGTLGGCVERNPEVLAEVSDAASCHFQHCHVLNDKSISSSLLNLKHLPVSGFELTVIQDCVEGYEDARSEPVGIIT